MAVRSGWYSQLKWSPAFAIADINQKRSIIPKFPGCYAFTRGSGPLVRGTLLYIGEATTSLAQRLGAYLVYDLSLRKQITDGEGEIKKRTEHKGKGFVFHCRAEYGDEGVFLRWVEYGGYVPELEASLIDWLDPMYNSRDESLYIPPLSPNERLNPRLLRDPL